MNKVRRICNTIKKKTREDIRKYNQEIIRATIVTSRSLRKVRRTQKLGQARLSILLDKQGREIHDQVNIIERIQEFYTALYDSEPSAPHWPKRCTSYKTMGGGSSTTRSAENIISHSASHSSLRESLRFSANSSSIDLASRTGDRRCIYLTPEIIYTYSSMTVHLQKESNQINTRRGVRQGVNISPKLFTAALENIFQ